MRLSCNWSCNPEGPQGARSPEHQSTDERIEIVEFPLDGLDTAIDRCQDAKSLIGLMMLKEII